MDIVEELETRGDELSLRAARYIRLKQRALGERDGPEQRESQLVTHDYNPHPKYPHGSAPTVGMPSTNG